MMYPLLLFIHSLFRWLVLVSLLYALYLSFSGWLRAKPFTALDNTVRHTTATIAHIQLTIGYILYFSSPLIKSFLATPKHEAFNIELTFFGLWHILLMTMAIVVITIGSAMTKRKAGDHEKFATMALWFTIALIIIFMAIPWPFAPWANRPYFRTL